MAKNMIVKVKTLKILLQKHSKISLQINFSRFGGLTMTKSVNLTWAKRYENLG